MKADRTFWRDFAINVLCLFVLPLSVVTCALFRGAQVPDTQATALRAAFIELYQADLTRALDSSPVCLEEVAAVRVAESRWAYAWAKAGLPSDPPLALTCPPARPSLDGGAE